MFEWGFPEGLVVCVMQHHHGLAILADTDLRHSAAAAVALASLIPDPLSQSVSGMQNLRDLNDIWKIFDLQQLAEDAYEEYEPQELKNASYTPLRDHLVKQQEAVVA